MAASASQTGTAAHTLLETCLLEGVDAQQFFGTTNRVDQDGDHSAIGASGSYRWINCPGSVALLDKLPPGESSSAEVPVDQTMVDGVQEAVDWVREQLAALPGAELHVETKVDLGGGLYGRNDIWIHQPCGKNIIADYKNGAMYVEVENNPQLMYYAVGVLRKSFMPKGPVTLAVLQPNCFGHKHIRTWDTTAEHLLDWFFNELLPAARATARPDAFLQEGEWCDKNFCDARATCPAKRKAVQDEAEKVFGDIFSGSPQTPALASMTPAEMGGLLETGRKLERYLKEVKSFAHSLAKSGTKVPGMKRVPTKGNRNWGNAAEAEVLLRAKGLGIELYGEPTFKSPAQIEAAMKAVKMKPKDRSDIVDPMVKRTIGEKFVFEDEGGVELPPPATGAFSPVGK